MPRWLPRVLARIHRLAIVGKVQFTEKALEELRALPLGISVEDAHHILENLTANECAGRLVSREAEEWLNRAVREGRAASGLRGDLVSRGGVAMTTQTKAKTKRRSAPKPRRGRELPDDACPTCGTIMRSARSKVFVSVNGDQMAVRDIPHLRCPKCGEGLFTLAAARERERRGIDLYRAKYGLLSADEIRAIREHHGLTQAELAQILRLGGNTLSRWEAGRNVQSAAMDVLLRLIRDLPGSLEYLREHAA